MPRVEKKIYNGKNVDILFYFFLLPTLRLTLRENVRPDPVIISDNLYSMTRRAASF